MRNIPVEERFYLHEHTGMLIRWKEPMSGNGKYLLVRKPSHHGLRDPIYILVNIETNWPYFLTEFEDVLDRKIFFCDRTGAVYSPYFEALETHEEVKP